MILFKITSKSFYTYQLRKVNVEQNKKKNPFLILPKRFDREYLDWFIFFIVRNIFSKKEIRTYFFPTIRMMIYVLVYLFLCDLLSDNISLTLTLHSTTSMSNKREHTHIFLPFHSSFLFFLFFLLDIVFFLSCSSSSSPPPRRRSF